MFDLKKISIVSVLLLLLSFTGSSELNEVYELKIEAGGCAYQITVNEKTVLEGKSYQDVNKKIKINEQLTEDGEQYIDAYMSRITREIPLRNTKAFIKLKLEKTVKDSVILIKELKLPTFLYDDDESQPQSISGSIQFKLDKKDLPNEKTVKTDSIQSKN